MFLVVMALTAIDQVSKWLVETRLPFQQTVELIPFLSLHRTHNEGIAFSLLAWAGNFGLIVLALLVMGFMLYLWSKVRPDQQLAHLGFAFVLGGALGNLIDRIVESHVIDFILVHTSTWAFAVFNFADAFITIGAIAIIIDELFSIKADRNAAKTQSD